jgi:hypothetical protein
MSAAATAAGYLYASGRLRGRGGKDETEAEPPREKRKVRVEVFDHEAAQEQPEAPPKPKRVPKIEYRRRRIPHE